VQRQFDIRALQDGLAGIDRAVVEASDYVTDPLERRRREPGDDLASALLNAALFGAAVYVGYFGAGGGVLLLAVLGVMVDEALARVNAIKNVVSGLANFVAAAGFAIFAPVRWSFVVPLAAGFLIGGWTGPKIVRRMPGEGLRIVVALAGLALAAKLALDAYR